MSFEVIVVRHILDIAIEKQIIPMKDDGVGCQTELKIEFLTLVDKILVSRSRDDHIPH